MIKNLTDKENPESRNNLSGFFIALIRLSSQTKTTGETAFRWPNGGLYFGGVMGKHDDWYLGKGKFPISKREPSLWSSAKFYIFGVLLASLILVCFFLGTARAEYSDEQIVNAIYKAEGGAKATYAYGIRSVKYSSKEEARRICFNTVRNNKKRFAKQTKYTDFIEFLGSRYCPVGCDNDRGTNKYWVKNVRNFLKEA